MLFYKMKIGKLKKKAYTEISFSTSHIKLNYFLSLSTAKQAIQKMIYLYCPQLIPHMVWIKVEGQNYGERQTHGPSHPLWPPEPFFSAVFVSSVTVYLPFCTAQNSHIIRQSNFLPISHHHHQQIAEKEIQSFCHYWAIYQ